MMANMTLLLWVETKGSGVFVEIAGAVRKIEIERHGDHDPTHRRTGERT
jgi:hypothetical protein